jgi:hypothetical protein
VAQGGLTITLERARRLESRSAGGQACGCDSGEVFPNMIESQSGLSFAEFFQNERDTSRKGIVVIGLPLGDGQ